MNRLVIIGNGFDLAHGLPTSYRDFINDYWRNVIKIIESDYKYIDGYISISLESIRQNPWIKIDWENITDFKTLFNKVSDLNEISFDFNNQFFKIISERSSFKNWVDIENEYYEMLKDYLRKSYSIDELNKQFEEVKFLLEKYLVSKIEKVYNFQKNSVEEILDIFKINRLDGNTLDVFFQEISKKDVDEFDQRFKKERRDIFDLNARRNYVNSIFIKNFFLSFNYTSTVANYNKILGNGSEGLIEIHGRLEDERNPINFGFGDEMDKHYQEIEEKNDNEYLKNIKSFQYLHTSNYKRLLDLIDSDKFQVYIMGHSCGLSDRTLLNTIFEHENCRSIKVFYHQKEDGTDNYTEITQNISRHFNKKKLMREKIVNKTLCQPLPQIQLPKKQ